MLVKPGDRSSLYGQFDADGTYYKLSLTLKPYSPVFIEIATRAIRGVDDSANRDRPGPLVTRWWSWEYGRRNRDNHLLLVEHGPRSAVASYTGSNRRE